MAERTPALVFIPKPSWQVASTGTQGIKRGQAPWLWMMSNIRENEVNRNYSLQVFCESKNYFEIPDFKKGWGGGGRRRCPSR